LRKNFLGNDIMLSYFKWNHHFKDIFVRHSENYTYKKLLISVKILNLLDMVFLVELIFTGKPEKIFTVNNQNKVLKRRKPGKLHDFPTRSQHNDLFLMQKYEY
jgi:hypothetical protein